MGLRLLAWHDDSEKIDRQGILSSYFDDWIQAVTEDEENWKIGRYILNPKTEKHIETIEWV